jgi:hypothetical protein
MIGLSNVHGFHVIKKLVEMHPATNIPRSSIIFIKVQSGDTNFDSIYVRVSRWSNPMMQVSSNVSHRKKLWKEAVDANDSREDDSSEQS